MAFARAPPALRTGGLRPRVAPDPRPGASGGRDPGDVRRAVALCRHVRPCARRGGAMALRRRAQRRDRRAARTPEVGGRRRARGGQRRGRAGPARGGGLGGLAGASRRGGPLRHGAAPRRARLLGRPLAERDRRLSRPPSRNGEDADARGSGTARATRSRRSSSDRPTARRAPRRSGRRGARRAASRTRAAARRGRATGAATRAAAATRTAARPPSCRSRGATATPPSRRLSLLRSASSARDTSSPEATARKAPVQKVSLSGPDGRLRDARRVRAGRRRQLADGAHHDASSRAPRREDLRALAHPERRAHGVVRLVRDQRVGDRRPA